MNIRTPVPVLGLALLIAVPPTSDAAVRPLTRDERNAVHFGFATQLGSGVYEISGRTLQIYRLPFAYRAREDGPDRVGVRITLPVTIGFFGFKPQDVLETGLPQHLDTLSFVPGIAIEVPLRHDWQLEPFMEAGVALDRTTDFDERVGSIGLRSRYDFDWRGHAGELYNELVRVRVEQKQPDLTDDFTRLRTGLTARRAFRTGSTAGARADYLLYVMHEWFPDPPRGWVNGKSQGGSATQIELGVTFGATETLHLGRIPLPRVGLGYRFAGDLSIIRLVFGSPY